MTRGTFPTNRTELVALGVLTAVSVALGALFAVFFNRLPVEGTTLAIDWKGLWADIRSGVHYGTLRNPPWSIFFLYPLTWLPMQAAWGVAMYLTLMVLIVSVPPTHPRWRHWLGVLLLTTSIPSLRHMADGNLEGVMVAGLLLVLYGYHRASAPALAAGLLLGTAKPQQVFLLLPVLGVYMLLTLSRRVLLQTAAMCLTVMIPALVWRGEEWWAIGINAIPDRNSLMDMSLMAALNRMGLGAPTVKIIVIGAVAGLAFWTAWQVRPVLSRELVGMLVAASLLAAPYSAGNSVLVVLALGVIPVFQRRVVPGLVLIALYNASIVLNNVEYRHLAAYYQTGLTLLSLLVLAADVLHQRRQPEPSAGSTAVKRQQPMRA